MRSLMDVVSDGLCGEHRCAFSVVGVVNAIRREYKLVRRKPRAQSRRRKG